jgi:hypothetical protein
LLPAVLPAAALLFAYAAPAAAEMCSTGAAGTAATCAPARGLAQDLAEWRADRTLSGDPASDRTRRLNMTGPAQSDVIAPPFAMGGGDDTVNFATSLTQWGSAFSAADMENLKEAQKAAGENAALPKPAAARPRFDLWAEGRSERFSEAGSPTKRGSAVTTYVGADYRWHKTFLVGGMIQLDDSRQTILAAPDVSDGKGYMAGPYMAYRVAPNVMLDARLAWGAAHDSAIAGTESLDLATTRMLTEATLSGNWGWNSWQLSPSGAITYLDETHDGLAGMSQFSTDVTRFSVGPELRRHIDGGNGASIEPFAFFKSSLDLAEAGWEAPLAQNTVGGGVTLAKPETYNIRAAADFTESVGGGDRSATGKISVSVPASLLGF